MREANILKVIQVKIIYGDTYLGCFLEITHLPQNKYYISI
jgi:hypothetical protein